MSSEGRGLFSRKHERLSPVGDESGVNMKLSYNADAGKLNLTLDEDLSSVVESPLAEYLFKEKRRCRTLQASGEARFLSFRECGKVITLNRFTSRRIRHGYYRHTEQQVPDSHSQGGAGGTVSVSGR